jgi:hypothetical protein
LHERERRTDNTLKTALLIYRCNSHSCNSHVTPPRNSQLTRHTLAQLTLAQLATHTSHSRATHATHTSHFRATHTRNSHVTLPRNSHSQLTRHTPAQLTFATRTSYFSHATKHCNFSGRRGFRAPRLCRDTPLINRVFDNLVPLLFLVLFCICAVFYLL